MTGTLLLAWLAAAPATRAAVIAGRDCNNGPIVCDGATLVCGSAEFCGNGDELQGTFTRVSLFSVPASTTVLVYPAAPLAVYATTVSIAGVIDGTGRGFAGGGLGPENSPGLDGSGTGKGRGAVAGKGGAGGGHGANGGLGTGSSQNAVAGTAYGAAFEAAAPISIDDVEMGSGGGGGGGGGTNHGSGAGGAPGGGSVYIEASSFTILGAGSILVDGGNASAAADSVGAAGAHPGGGGGGSGGGILLRVMSRVEATGTGRLSAKGGNGSLCATVGGGTVNPGAGGAGGRIKIFANASSFSVPIATGIGFVGGKFALTSFESTGTANNGSTGTASFGVVASSPTAPSIAAVYLSSVTYTWNIDLSTWGDAPAASRRFHVFASSSFAPLPGPQVEVGSGTNTGTERSIRPNSLYARVITAYTTWGESQASNAVSTVTFASPPGPSTGTAFSNVQERQLTFHWGHGSGAEANPEDTEYEAWRSTRSDLGAASTTRLVAISTTALNLTPETVYFFRVRAVNRAGTLTSFSSTFSIATSTTPPTRPGAPVPASPFSYDATGTLSWAAASAPSGIKEYLLQVGSFPGGADVVNQVVGNVTTFNLAGLASGRSYFGRARARSNAELDGDFSDAGPPLTVFVPAVEPAIAKPINWPNPFDPSAGPTTIGFSLPEPATVTMRIFSLTGKLVYQEERHFGTTGNQLWPWDGRSSSGRRVSPGGYILQLEKRMPSGVDIQRSKLAVLY